MSHFSTGQLNQLGDALEVAGWNAEDVTRLGQMGRERLIQLRDSLRTSDIIVAIEGGKTKLWFHSEQEVGWVQGRKILVHLEANSLLAGCVGEEELRAIQGRGIEFFRRHFAGKVIFGWRGVRGDNVPFLIEYGNEVILNWFWLDYYWSTDDPALRFEK